MSAAPSEPRPRVAGLRGRLAALLGREAAGAATPSPYHATRRRLVAINLAVVSAILLLMTTSIYLVESQALQQQVERQLRSHAEGEIASGAASIAASRGATPTTPPSGQTADDGHGDGDNYEPGGPNIFSVILDTSGATVIDASGVRAFGLPDRAAAAPVLSGARTESLVSARIQGQEYLLLTKALYAHDRLVGALQVGQSLAPMEQQTHDLILILLIVGVGGLALTAGASLYLADRALRPMRLAYERQRQFAAAASHELRTPLAFVRSQLELVSRHVKQAQPATLAASVGEDLGDTLHEVDYMTRLVRDLLLIARDEGDHRGIAWRPVDLRRLARDVAETARPSAEQRGLTLAAPDSEPAWVMGDYDRLRQLLLILLDNATRYTPAGGRVWLDVRSGRGSLLGGRRPLAQVIVGDTGVGIAPDQQERIFEAFYRSEGHSANANHGGAGLGLALARWLVGAHEGEISVKSAPGEGSVFTVSLPLLTDRKGGARPGGDAPHAETEPPALLARPSDSAPVS